MSGKKHLPIRQITWHVPRRCRTTVSPTPTDAEPNRSPAPAQAQAQEQHITEENIRPPGAVRGCLPSAQPNTNHHVRRPTPSTPKSPQVSPRPHPILHPPMTTRHVSPTRARAPPPIRFSSVGTSLTDRVCAIPRARASFRAANSPHDVGLGPVLRARARACVRRVAYTSFPAASRLTHHRFHPPSPRLADLAVPIYNDQRREKPQVSTQAHTNQTTLVSKGKSEAQLH